MLSQLLLAAAEVSDSEAWGHIAVEHCIYDIYSVYADEKGKFDELVEEQGVRVLIDPGALMHVVGTKMDFVEDRLK